MLAIFKREFLSYFKSPVAYIAFALFSFLSGFVFVTNFSNGAVNISSEIISLRGFFVIVVPIITMGLFAEDKKRGTDIIYYTTPISLFSVVLGKFLAAFALFGVLYLNVVIHIFVTLGFDGTIDYGVLGSTIVFFVMAALFIAIGLLASAITDNQIVAAILSFVMIMVVQLLPTIGQFVATVLSSLLNVIANVSASETSKMSENIVAAFTWLNPFDRTNDFKYGVFSLVAVIFCVSFAAFFLFLSYRVLEKKRWSQS